MYLPCDGSRPPIVLIGQAGAGGQKYVMRDLMRVLEQEKHAYADPVTEVMIDRAVVGDGDVVRLSRVCTAGRSLHQHSK